MKTIKFEEFEPKKVWFYNYIEDSVEEVYVDIYRILGREDCKITMRSYHVIGSKRHSWILEHNIFFNKDKALEKAANLLSARIQMQIRLIEKEKSILDELLNKQIRLIDQRKEN